MRLDYPLYGVAIVLFIVSAALFAVDQQNILYAAAPAVLGLLFAVGGYILKPKVPPVQPIQPVSTQTAVAVPVQQKTDIQPVVVETPKEETPVANPPSEPMPPPEATPEVKMQTTETSVAAEAATTAQVSAGSTETAIPTSDLRKIRGISENRVSQLKENGILTVADLAKASPADLATKLGVPEKIVKMWVGSAKKMAT